MEDGTLILVAGSLLALGLGATLLAGRLRVPGLVLFLVLGMVIGSEGLGLIEFGGSVEAGGLSIEDVELTRTIGIIALSLILFEGGLAAGWGEIRPVIAPSIALATVGTLLTAGITGFAAHWLLDLSVLEGLLLGSVAATTDSAAIFSVLRGSSIKRRLARTLEAESGLNDPVAILLVIGFIEWIQEPGYGALDMGGQIVVQLAIGGAVGLGVGRASRWSFQSVRLGTQGLYPVLSIATAALAYGAADSLEGSGFLAVYLAGLTLGGGSIPARRTVVDFHAGLAWVSQIALFFTLGLLVFPSELLDIAGEGLLLAGVLALVARPIAVVVATRVGAYPLRESLVLGWAGLRGALPVVFATFPVIEGIGQADRFFNLVFFVVLVSTLVQGVSFESFARALGLTTTEPALPRPLLEVGTIKRLGAEVVEYPVGEGDAIVGQTVNKLALPREALVSVIVRSDQALLPRGSTEIEGGDRLHILVRQPVRGLVEALFEFWREGPVGDPEPLAPILSGRRPVFSVRPWREEYGDPGGPDAIEGLEVVRTLRTRRGAPGALVQLEDGRFAATGEAVATGGARQLFRYCRTRIARATSEEERAWWQELAGVLSQWVSS